MCTALLLPSPNTRSPSASPGPGLHPTSTSSAPTLVLCEHVWQGSSCLAEFFYYKLFFFFLPPAPLPQQLCSGDGHSLSSIELEEPKLNRSNMQTAVVANTTLSALMFFKFWSTDYWLPARFSKIACETTTKQLLICICKTAGKQNHYYLPHSIFNLNFIGL